MSFWVLRFLTLLAWTAKSSKIQGILSQRNDMQSDPKALVLYLKYTHLKVKNVTTMRK